MTHGANLSIGVVVIGRNEGERLRSCLASLAGEAESGQRTAETQAVSVPPLVVYVDSASTDGSLELARSMGAEVAELDMSRPFSAARARNEGFALLRKIAPELQYVQFVDGDCAVDVGWIDTAARFLDGNPQYAVVAGRLRERYPDNSVYNRLCDMEWNTPVGDIDACGGIAMYRADAFEQVGRFDQTVIAGEEPELCVRLRQAGWKIRRLADEMALHDAAMTRFGQWWKRSVRSGYGGSDVAGRFEKGSGEFSRQVRSARVWGIGWPLMVLLAAMAGRALVGWEAAAIGAALFSAILPMQMARVGMRGFRRCRDPKTGAAYGVLTMLSKWAHLYGQCRYCCDRRSGRHLSLIEYKQPTGKDVIAHG